jgi:proteasome accessory factor B
MSSAKTERLVNLTMALLATQRYMQKSEIFRKVAGYSGSSETKERMFERDKDDLRNLGIEIEVASHDPLFEDEPGYRIRPDSYRMPLNTFSTEEVSIITTALGLWLDSGFENVANTAARRFRSLGEAELPFPVSPLKSSELTEEGLLEVTRALAQKSQISFDYRKPDTALAERRNVNPFGLSAWKGSWYLVGEDLDRDDIRVFKLDRITSTIEVSKKSGAFEIPSDFKVRDYLIMYSDSSIVVSALMRKDKAHSLRSRVVKVEALTDPEWAEDWEQVSYECDEFNDALQEALWYSDSLIIQSPSELREKIIESLERVAKSHG